MDCAHYECSQVMSPNMSTDKAFPRSASRLSSKLTQDWNFLYQYTSDLYKTTSDPSSKQSPSNAIIVNEIGNIFEEIFMTFRRRFWPSLVGAISSIPPALVEFLQVYSIAGIQVFQFEFLADCTIIGSSSAPIVQLEYVTVSICIPFVYWTL